MTCHKCVGAVPSAGLSRRAVLNRFGMGLGGIALANLINPRRRCWRRRPRQDHGVLGGQFHVPPKAKRVIYLFMAGGPSQMETFDYKPVLNQRNGEQLPDSVRQGQRLTGMSGNQASLPLAGSRFGFARHGAAAPGSAICCRTPPRSSTTSASSARCTPRPSTTIRRSRSSRPARRSPAARAWARGCTTGSAATTTTCRRSSC